MDGMTGIPGRIAETAAEYMKGTSKAGEDKAVLEGVKTERMKVLVPTFKSDGSNPVSVQKQVGNLAKLAASFTIGLPLLAGKAVCATCYNTLAAYRDRYQNQLETLEYAKREVSGAIREWRPTDDKDLKASENIAQNTDDLNSLLQEEAQLDAKIREKRGQVEKLDSKLSKLDNLREKAKLPNLDNLREKVGISKTRTEDLPDVPVQKELTPLEKKEHLLQQLQKEVARLEKRKDEFQEEIGVQENSKMDASSLKGELVNVESNITNRKNDIEKLKVDIAKGHKAKEAEEDAKALGNLISKHEQEITDLNKDLEIKFNAKGQTPETDAINKKIFQKEAELESMKNMRDGFVAHSKVIEAKTEEGFVGESVIQLEQLESRKAKLEDDVKNLKFFETFEGGRLANPEKLNDLNRQIQELDSQIEDLKGEKWE